MGLGVAGWPRAQEQEQLLDLLRCRGEASADSLELLRKVGAVRPVANDSNTNAIARATQANCHQPSDRGNCCVSPDAELQHQRCARGNQRSGWELARNNSEGERPMELLDGVNRLEFGHAQESANDVPVRRA
jgi:hypothetical protein